MTDSMSFYDAFQRRMNMDSNDKARPRIGVTGEALDIAEVMNRDGMTTSEDAYNMMSSAPHSQNDNRNNNIRVGSGKNSIAYNSAVAGS